MNPRGGESTALPRPAAEASSAAKPINKIKQTTLSHHHHQPHLATTLVGWVQRSETHHLPTNPMTSYRRNHVPGGIYFFTVAIANRRHNLLLQHIETLRAAYREERQTYPFATLGLVVLPDHIHAVWRLPTGDADYSNRWRRIKARFSAAMPSGEQLSKSRASKGERGIWQRRFWEHTLRDLNDLRRHLDYLHFNPVKHGLVSKVVDWPHSTFHGYVQRGVYPADWGGGNVNARGFGD